MIFKIKISVLIIITTLATGCTTFAKGHAFRSASSPDQNSSLLYIYRTESTPFMRQPTVLINGEELLDLPNGGYTYLYLRPGEYRIEFDWAWDVSYNDREIELDARPGEAYKVRIGGGRHCGVIFGNCGNDVTVETKHSDDSQIDSCKYQTPNFDFL